MTRDPSSKQFSMVQRVDYLKQACKAQSVLHLGCTNWPYLDQSKQDDRFLHQALAKVTSELWGLDQDREGLEALRNQGFDHLHHGDLEDLSPTSITRTFDVVLAGEVIEHLSNPGLFLRGVTRFMTAETELIVTTVNAYCAFRAAIYALRGRGGRNEPIHPDHVAYFSYNTLELLGRRAGFHLDQFYFYDIGREHRQFVGRSTRLINDLTTRLFPQMADGVIAVFRHPDPQAASLNGRTPKTEL